MMPYGRGGAGNLAQQQDVAKRMAQDVEANHSASSDADAIAAAVAEAKAANRVDEYAHMGRGGAGNWYSPPTLATTGSFVTSPDPTTAASKAQAQAEADNTRSRGRGGAGNFVWGSETKETELKEMKAREETLKTDIAKLVEAGLAKPSKVVLKAEGVDEAV